MKCKLLISILFIVLFIGLISADTAFYIKKGEVYDIKISCENNGARCRTGTCNITINYPNLTSMVNDGGMTNLNNGYFNYTLNENQTIVNGEYFTRVECNESGLNDTSNFIYEVNPTGIRPSDQKT